MATTNGVESGHYFSRSWALLTRDKGWIKPVLVLPLALLVPVAGSLGVLGYQMEWARLTAWGVDSAPKQKNVQVGKVIASGWRCFLVGLGWAAAAMAAEALVGAILGVIPGYEDSAFSALVDFLFWALNLIVGLVVTVAMIRASVYQKASAGYQLDRIFQMVRHDFGGLMHILGIQLVGSLVVGAAVGISAIIAVLSMLPSFFHMMAYSTGGDDVAMLMTEVLTVVGPIGVILGYVVAVISVALSLIVTTAIALWMRQFDVQHWGKSADPLPQPLTSPESAAPQSPTGYAYTPYQPAPAEQQPQAWQQPAAPVQPVSPAAAPEPEPPAQPDDTPTQPVTPVPMPPAGGWEQVQDLAAPDSEEPDGASADDEAAYAENDGLPAVPEGVAEPSSDEVVVTEVIPLSNRDEDEQ